MVVSADPLQPEIAQERPLGGQLSARLRICIVSDDLSGVPDEGVKKFTVALAAAINDQYQVSILSTKGPSQTLGVTWVPSPNTFLSRGLRAAVRQQDPDILVYAARGSATFFSFLRSRILQSYCPRAQVVMLGLQTRRHRGLEQQIIRRIKPGLVCVQSTTNRDYVESLGCAVQLLTSGVDTDTFRPVDAERRRELCHMYGLDPDIPVVLHVGHLTNGRRISVLAELAARNKCQVVLVASSSTEQQAILGEQLREAGVRVLTQYEPHIEQLYQLASCYVFPVESTNNAIEAPLSVLEALACDIPVVTTRFAGLPRMFEAHTTPSGPLVFVDSAEDLVEEALRLCRDAPKGARQIVLPHSWSAVAAALIERVRLIGLSPGTQV